MTFAIQETRTRRTPSPERAKVANWIVWPSLLAMICGAFFFGGAGTVYMAFYNVSEEAPRLGSSFIVGMACAGLGFSGLITVWVKSISFDASPATQETVRIPIPMQGNEPQQWMGGNAPIPVPTNGGHVVEYDEKGTIRRFTFNNDQMNKLANRYFEENTDYRITRDDPTGKKIFADWHFVKYIMIGAKYWTELDGKVYWSDDGGAWFESRMRMITA